MDRSTIRISRISQKGGGNPTVGRFTRQSAELKDFPKLLADSPPTVVADDLLFRWAHIIKIAKMVPGMSAVRALEQRVQANSCRSCQKPTVIFDRSPLDNARRFLGECSDAVAKLVKEAAGIVKYRVSYRDLAGVPRDVVR
jgi:hypothetical protein